MGCPHKSFLKTCSFCGQAGHMEKTCQERRAQAIARHADWTERQKHVAATRARNAEWLARHAEKIPNFALPAQSAAVDVCGVDDFDARSAISSASSSTAATKTSVTLVLTEQETKEARKYSKLLREIAVIEQNVTNGEKVDMKQLDKMRRRSEIEGTLVMTKLRAGYAFSSDEV